MNVKIIAIIVIFVNNFRFCQSAKYHNFSLFTTVPTESDHLQFLQNLDHQKYINVIFWKKPYKLYESVQLLVDPLDKGLFLERVHHYKLNVNLLLNDTQRAFDNQIVQKNSKLRAETYSWKYYHTLDDVYHWLAGIAEKYADIVELVSIGKSVEGRDIYVLSTKPKDLKIKVIVEGGIHGNEWISVEFMTYFLYQLLKNTKKSNVLGQLLQKYEWHFIPIVNPDGYDYTHKTDRLWRKNRRFLGKSFGVDLNRNFNYNFGRFGTSSEEKDDCYCGPHAFSEPESKALADFVAQNKKGLKFYFSFHGYGQKIIIPYADTIKHVENYGETEKCGKQAISKIYNMNGVKYKLGTHYDTLGLRISGNSASYVKNTHAVRYVYTFLLRDNGTYGYALPPEQILPSCEETLAGIIDLMTTKQKTGRRTLLFNGGQQLRHQMISFMAIPLKESHVKFLKSLVNSYDVNYWRDVGVVYSAVDFVAHPDDQPDLLKDARKHGVDLKPIIDDVQKAFDRQIVKPYIKRRMNSMDWRTYFRLDDIYAWLKDLSEAYPGEVTTKSIGKTHENRDIMSIRVALKESQLRSTVIIEGGIHAREWIAPAVVTYFISSIVNARTSKIDDLKKIALTYEWYFIPVLNPDGYEYTHTADRLWRKNRNSVPVDLNRNFDAGFEPSTSDQKWLDSYAGETAFSEKETIAMSEFVKSKSRKLEYYMAFHSYGEYMILPYGYSKEHLDNYDEVFKMCTTAADSIYKRYHTTYLVGTPFETVGYMATGVAACWVKKAFSVPYVITFELRDKGREGFTLAPSKILPTCEETLDGLISLMAGKQLKKPRKSKSSQPHGVVDQVYRMCTEAARKIYERHGVKYLTGTVFETLGYTATGASGSWVKKRFSVPYVISFELRDEGGEGFGLSPSQIIPTCEETLDGVISLLLRRMPQRKPHKKGKTPQEDKRKPIIWNSAESCKMPDQIMIVLMSFILF